MGIPHYLAMTGAELARSPAPEHTAWLACHFSPSGDGLSNFPPCLPEGAMLVLDDSTPVQSHDPSRVANQLAEQMGSLNCQKLLLDFQRSNRPENREMAAYLTAQLPFPVGVSHLYAEGLDCPVFVPPGALHQPLEQQLSLWKGREIWLETALNSEVLTLKTDGCTCSPAPEIPREGFIEEVLHCRYSVETGPDFARFTLWRTKSDLDNLLAQAQGLGATLAVGLWQEMNPL